MYLIGITNNGHNLGNEGTCITHYKAMYKIRECALNFKNMYGHEHIYVLPKFKYTQKVCEMDMCNFIKYVKQNSIATF